MGAESYCSSNTINVTPLVGILEKWHQDIEQIIAVRNRRPEEVCVLRFFCSDVNNHAPVIDKLWPAEPGAQRIYIGPQPLDLA